MKGFERPTFGQRDPNPEIAEEISDGDLTDLRTLELSVFIGDRRLDTVEQERLTDLRERYPNTSKKIRRELDTDEGRPSAA